MINRDGGSRPVSRQTLSVPAIAISLCVLGSLMTCFASKVPHVPMDTEDLWDMLYPDRIAAAPLLDPHVRCVIACASCISCNRLCDGGLIKLGTLFGDRLQHHRYLSVRLDAVFRLYGFTWS